MARYEYTDIEEYRSYIVGRAKTKLLYRSNNVDNADLVDILSDFFDDAHRMIVNWRKLKTEDEFLSQKWDAEITDFVVDSYRTMGDELLDNTSVNGISRTYKINASARLKSRIPQVM